MDAVPGDRMSHTQLPSLYIGPCKLIIVRNETRGHRLSTPAANTTSPEMARLSLPLQLASNGRLVTPLA